MAESAELAGGEQGDGERGGKDPLGRQMPGGDSVDDGKVKVPTLSDIGKSREILDELRRRADDPTRQAGERDYLRRLLDKLY